MANIQYLNPDSLPKNPAYSNVVVVPPGMKTIYVGGMDAVNAAGEIVGKGDIGAQSEQVYKNLEAALKAAGATLENVVKWNILLVQGQPLEPGLKAFQRVWGNRPNPPVITMAYVAALARPDLLIEMDAIAAIE